MVIGVVAVMVVGLLVYLLRQPDDATMAQQPGPQQEQPEDTPPGKVPPPQSTDPGTPAPKPEIPDPETPDPEVPDPEVPDPEVPDPADVPTDPQETPGDQPTDPEVPDPGDDPGRSLADLIDPVDPNDPGNNPPTNPGSENPQPNGPVSPKRLAVPDKEARQEAEKKIREIFGREFADARDPEKKAALAAKLFMQGQETTDDPVARFVLMRLACEMSADAGELTAPLDMVDRMQQLYDVDPLAIKAYLLEKVVGSMQPGAKPAATSQQVVDTAMQLIDEAVATDDFTVAGRFAKAAAAVARKSKDTALLREVTTRNRELDRQKQRFTAAKNALEVLAEDPADAAANLTAGRYYCFDSGNWEKGLPMLAKGNDPVLLKLAERDLATPEDPATQVELADGWWELAEKQPSLIKPAMQARAAYWYSRAVPALAGLDKTRVEKRLEAMAAVAEAPDSKTRGVVQAGNVALASNGTTVSGKITWGAALLDGKLGYNDREYAFANCPGEWIITLDKVYRLREIRFLLWNLNENRYYRYVVETSADGKAFAPLVNRSVGNWTDWQWIPFPRPVKAIKLTGLFGNAMNRFYVVEFEAYCIPPSPRPK